jgi:hypothetical protein
LLDTPGHPRKNRGLRGPSAACACLEAAISLPFLRRSRAQRELALVALLSLLPAMPAGAEFYRWTDAEGVTHYSSDPERIPGRYRASAERVKSSAAPTRGPLPLIEGEPGPAIDGPDTNEPGQGKAGPAPIEPRPALPPAGEPASATALPPPAAPDPDALPADVDPREVEVAELEQELNARREELKTLISQSSFDSSRISTDPRLRELAEIVPRLQAELDALRRELGR